MLKPTKMENCYLTFQIANKGADQTAQMRRLVCAFAVCKQQSKDVLRRCTYDAEAQASWPPPGAAPGSRDSFCAI